MSQYSIFGAVNKEPPQVTNARVVLGIGRDATEDEIKKTYRKLSMQWHPDRHSNQPTQKEAEQRFKLYTSANELLTKENRRKEAESEFSKALEEPFIVGDRVFCLGTLYGTRIYLPEESKGVAITDSKRLLGGKGASYEASYSEIQHKKYYGIRKSIMESQFADMLEMFYSGTSNGKHNEDLLIEGFVNREKGGLDDLVWIKENELGIFHFLNREFNDSVRLFSDINNRLHDNIIFMYRWGVSLEARVALPNFKSEKKDEWKKDMNTAIILYNKCLHLLSNRKYSFPENYDGIIPRHNPQSMLTVMMQLADAYECIGENDKARKLWMKARDIDPKCYEAQVKAAGHVIKISPVRKFFGLLTSGKN